MQDQESVWRRWHEALPWTVLVASACILAALIICLPLNVDELEFHRATRWVGQGKMPYRDFWEHHTPLQWFLFAPVTQFFKEASATNVLALRWAQIPLEVLTVLVLISLMRRKGVRWPVVPLALGPILSSRLIGSPMVGYRLDTLMNLLFLTGFALLEWDADDGARPWRHFMSGACLALACLCSQRMLPMALLVPAVYFVRFKPEARGLKFRPRWQILWTVAGGGVVACLTMAFFWSRGALGAFFQQCVRDNAAYEASCGGGAHSTFGFQFVALPWQIGDWCYLYTVVLGLGGIVFMLLRRKPPEAPLRLAALVVGQLLLLATLTTPNVYQQQTMIWLLVIMAGLFLNHLWILGEARARMATAIGATALALAVVAATNVGLTWRMGRAIQRHQDHVIRLVHAIAGPKDTVLDGSGYAFERSPACRFWFLTRIAKCLMDKGYYSKLDKATFLEKKPSVLVMDGHLSGYLMASPLSLQEFVCRNYLPLETCVWVPAPNVLMSGQRPRASWPMLKSGLYRVCLGDPKILAGWFERPFAFSYIENINLRHDISDIRKYELDARKLMSPGEEAQLAWSLDGVPIHPGPDGWMALKAGQRLEVLYGGKQPLALLLVPNDFPLLFLIPFPRVPFELVRDEPP